MFFVMVLLFVYGCPIYRFFHIPCPCCGVTRAWIACLQGDIVTAFRYHALFPVIPVLILLYICQGQLPSRWQKCMNVIFLTAGIAIFVYGILRWVGFVDMP